MSARPPCTRWGGPCIPDDDGRCAECGDKVTVPVHGDVVHMKASDGPCELHAESTEGLTRKLVDAIRERCGASGVNVCPACINRAVTDVAIGPLRADR